VPANKSDLVKRSVIGVIDEGDQGQREQNEIDGYAKHNCYLNVFSDERQVFPLHGIAVRWPLKKSDVITRA
jgi:hypothetical protein